MARSVGRSIRRHRHGPHRGCLRRQLPDDEFQAPASQPFQIAFDNQDASIPHNIQIADGSGAFVFEGDTVTGVNQITYDVPALAAGQYKFSCKWHPNMVGDLTVQ